MKVYLKYAFFAYVIILAIYVSYSNLMQRRFGQQEISFTKPQQNCYQSAKDWRYCVYTTDRTQKNAYLYVFHDKDEDETFWMDESSYPALLQNYWEGVSKKIPTVVTVSFGPVWVATTKLTMKNSGILDRLQYEVIPAIENKLGAPQQRFLLGASMGGLNVLATALQMPDSFSRVAALCPALYKLSPFANWYEIFEFVTRTGARPSSVLGAMGIGRNFFANTEEWKAFSPLENIQNTRFKPHQRLYISTGLQDRFGSFEGAELFMKRARQQGIKTFWYPNSGDHCAVDAQSLGRFLSL